MDLLFRAIAALALLALIALGLRLARVLFARRTNRIVAAHNAAPAQAGGERVLYFTSDRCVQCLTRQEPALRALTDAAPTLAVQTFNAARDHAVAAAYGILTAPSTVVIRADGRVAAINHGFAPARQIAAQLGWPAAPPAALL